MFVIGKFQGKNIFLWHVVFTYKFFKDFFCGILILCFGQETVFCGISISQLNSVDFRSQPRNHENFMQQKFLALKQIKNCQAAYELLYIPFGSFVENTCFSINMVSMTFLKPNQSRFENTCQISWIGIKRIKKLNKMIKQLLKLFILSYSNPP